MKVYIIGSLLLTFAAVPLLLWSCNTTGIGNEPVKEDTVRQLVVEAAPAKDATTSYTNTLLDSLHRLLPLPKEQLEKLLGENFHYVDYRYVYADVEPPEAKWGNAYHLGDSLVVAVMDYNDHYLCSTQYLVILNIYTLKATDSKAVAEECDEDQSQEEVDRLSYNIVNDSTFYTEIATVKLQPHDTVPPKIKRTMWVINKDHGLITPAAN